jgi:hypothetical protein
MGNGTNAGIEVTKHGPAQASSIGVGHVLPRFSHTADSAGAQQPGTQPDQAKAPKALDPLGLRAL